MAHADRTTVVRLALGLRDPRPHARWAAANELARLGPAAAEAVPQLAALLDDRDALVRRAAHSALRAIDPTGEALQSGPAPRPEPAPGAALSRLPPPLFDPLYTIRG